MSNGGAVTSSAYRYRGLVGLIDRRDLRQTALNLFFCTPLEVVARILDTWEILTTGRWDPDKHH
jgi:hypothetical protein